VLGVLSIIFGGLALAGGTCVAGVGSCHGPDVGAHDDAIARVHSGGLGADEARVVSEANAAGWASVHVQAVLFAVLSLPLFVIGIGQVRYRSWAGRATVIWGIVALVSLGAVTIVNALLVDPKQFAAFRLIWESARQHPMPEPGGCVGAATSLAASVPKLILLGAFPIVLLAFFSRPNVAAALRVPRAQAPDAETAPCPPPQPSSPPDPP
jgi:hypothetical protein